MTADPDPARGCVEITVHGPETAPPDGLAAVHEQGADFWTLAMTR